MNIQTSPATARNAPSEKALSPTEELLGSVHPGMSRAAANTNLVEAAVSLVNETERFGAEPHAAAIQHFLEAMRGHHPIHTNRDQ